jgi:hypothetical protein
VALKVPPVQASSGAPSGTVTLMDGSKTLGTGTLGVVKGVCQATYSTSSLTAGSHSITAVYGGSTVYSSSTSSPITESVGKGATSPNVAMAAAVLATAATASSSTNRATTQASASTAAATAIMPKVMASPKAPSNSPTLVVGNSGSRSTKSTTSARAVDVVHALSANTDWRF